MDTRHTPTPHATTIAFLIELRRRLLYYLAVVVAVIFLLTWQFNSYYKLVLLPFLNHLLIHMGLNVNHSMPPVFSFKLLLVSTIFATIFVFFYQALALVLPGLYHDARRNFWGLFLLSLFLFALGVVFAYFLFLPWILHDPEQQATYSWISGMMPLNYLMMVLKWLLACGLLFELPLVVFLFNKTVKLQQLVHRRVYGLITGLIISFLLNPVDGVCQLLFTFLFCLLFELGMIASR